MKMRSGRNQNYKTTLFVYKELPYPTQFSKENVSQREISKRVQAEEQYQMADDIKIKGEIICQQN